jgi:hypothetical protein
MMSGDNELPTDAVSGHVRIGALNGINRDEPGGTKSPLLDISEAFEQAVEISAVIVD